MKILHVVEAFGGGVYSFLKDLCNNNQDNSEIIIAYSHRPQTPKKFQDEFDKKIKFIDLKMTRNISFSKDIKNLIKIMEIIKTEKPDIIHLHSSKAGFLGRVACFILGIDSNKVFYNPHGFSFLQQDKSKKMRYLYFLLEKIAAKMSGNIVAVSKSEAEEALKISNNVIRIDNTINEKEINMLVENKIEFIENNKIIIGTIGRISFQKNPKLFNIIAEKYRDIHFLWIGDGELRDELYSPNIEVTGWMEREDALKKMQNITIYLQTSLWEGLPIALLEAMYLKKPIIANNVIGNRDVIINEYNGYLCNNLEEFIVCINKIIGDKALLDEMGSNSRKFVIANHSFKKMINYYYNAYLGKYEYYSGKESKII